MSIGALDLFRIGIGPSSSHTVGPMRAARRFAAGLRDDGAAERVARLRIELFGSLAATGDGHGTITAVVVGLTGAEPHVVDRDEIERIVAATRAAGSLTLFGGTVVPFSIDDDIVMRPDETLPGHPNGMRFEAVDSDHLVVATTEYYSVGGGFVLSANEIDAPIDETRGGDVPHPFHSAAELVERCIASDMSIAELAMSNERALRGDGAGPELLAVWQVMRDCVERGSTTEGLLPGGLGVRRRAASLRRALETSGPTADPLSALDWVDMWALAVNEENAAGGRVVTAPTNGAAGVVPAVLHYYSTFVPGADDEGVIAFLATAGAIGTLFKMNASISGAEVGCQGEVGSACAMAAAGLTEVLGGTPAQVENAAEIALEHNLGLTCDPVAGLVQVPCIERNAMAAIKAINAARLALRGDGSHLVSLDEAIETLRDTGRDMHDKYKETARGGLAVTFRTKHGAVVPVPVTVVEC